MDILIIFDPDGRGVAHTAKQLAEVLRRNFRKEPTLVSLGDRSPNLNRKAEFVILLGDLWKSKLGKSLAGFIEDHQEQLASLNSIIAVKSYLEDDEFMAKMARELPNQVLESAMFPRLGMNVTYQRLSPLDKIWWKLSRQKTSLPYRRAQLDRVVSLIED